MLARCEATVPVGSLFNADIVSDEPLRRQIYRIDSEYSRQPLYHSVPKIKHREIIACEAIGFSVGDISYSMPELPDQGPSDPRRIVMRWVFSVAGADPDSLVPTTNARATPALGTSQSTSQPIGAPQTNAFVNP